MEHFAEYLGTFYCYRRHKFAVKLFLAETGEGAVGGGVCRHSIASIVVSNIAGRHGYLPLVIAVFCQVEVSVHHSSRGILPSVVCLSAIVKLR